MTRILRGVVYDDRVFTQKKIQTLYKVVRSSSKEIISNPITHIETWNDIWDCYGVEVTIVKQDFDVWMEVGQVSDKSFKAIIKDGKWCNEIY